MFKLVLPAVLLSLAASASAQSVVTKCTVPNTAALTFDDGPYIYMNEVVDTLKNAKAKGTFFFNGKNWGCIYDEDNVERVRYAYDNGFQVASHTWAHKDLSTLSRDQVNSEMERTEVAIQRITGALPAYTRPPYGSYNDVVLQVAEARGQKLANWDFDSGDSSDVKVDDQKARYDDVAARHPSTVLSLEHEVHETSVRQVLPYAIKKLQDAGYKLVTLAECLGTQPYVSTGKPAARDGSWQC